MNPETVAHPRFTSRKLLFFLMSFAAAVILSYFERFDIEIGAFLLMLPSSYGFFNLKDRSAMEYISQLRSSS